MITRGLKISDLLEIDEFWRKFHKGMRGIPRRSSLISELVVENGKIIGYGMTKVYGEALMYLNRDASKFSQTKAFKLMMDHAIADAKRKELDILHVGVDDPNFEGLLRHHYKFTDRGVVLSLEL